MPDSPPRFPWSAPARPLLLEVILVAQRIHRLPEPSVKIDGERLLVSEALHRLTFPDGVVTVDELQHVRRQNEESAVDPTSISLRLFLKAGDEVVLEHKRAEPARRLYGSKG